MEYKTLNEYKEELHPWKPFIPDAATKIILGTFPTIEKNRGAFDFFYPNPKNDFWKLIFRVDNKELDDFLDDDPVKIRKQVLSNLKSGIADIGYRILRQRGSSKDQYLFPIEYTDIFALLDNHPTLRKIIVTSSSGSNSVLSWFHHYCELNNNSFKMPKGKLPKESQMIFKSRRIQISIIPSPSPLAPIKGEPLVEMYRKGLQNE